MNVEEYISARVKPRRDWYDSRAVRCKRLQLSMQYTATVMSIALVVLIHVDSIPRLALASMAALGTLALSVEGVGQFGNQWRLYRMTAEAVERELQLYLNQAGIYATVDNRDGTFVRQIEDLLSAEAEQWKLLALSMARSGKVDRQQG